MNKDIMRKAGFNKEIDRIEAKKCPFCGKTIDLKAFRSQADRREYDISGLCQKCQDRTFGDHIPSHRKDQA